MIDTSSKKLNNMCFLFQQGMLDVVFSHVQETMIQFTFWILFCLGNCQTQIFWILLYQVQQGL
jgi:hypothetical protein